MRDRGGMPPRGTVLAELLAEVCDLEPGDGEIVLQFTDGRLRRWCKRAGWYGADVMRRYDRGRLPLGPQPDHAE